MLSSSRRGGLSRGAHGPRSGLRWANAVVVLAFVVLAGRLWQLQVLSGDLYYRKSADNFVKELVLPAARGQIRDTRGRVLADNRPIYNIYVTPRLAKDPVLERLARHLQLDAAAVQTLRDKLDQRKDAERTRQLLAFEDVGRDQLAIVESERQELPGVSVTAAARRAYPLGGTAAHVVGYMNQIGADELVERKEQGYRAGDYVGRAGLERQWESFLRGTDGVDRIIVDAKGQRKAEAEVEGLLGGVQHLDPVHGHHVVTTLDLDLQMAVERALRRYPSAAAVVVDVHSGRVLALASMPVVDPNRLMGRMTRAEVESLQSDPRRPLVDKSVREHYFPGSTFKIVPMIAAIVDPQIDTHERMKCTGGYVYGNRTFHCVEAHGVVDLDQALAQSCNVYFYKLGDRLGLDRMAEIATELGFGASTGLGINGEVSGFVPTMEYYDKQGSFQKGFLLNTAIGQGSVKATVMQVAMAYAAVANGGKLWVPQIVDRVETASGRLVQAFQPRLRRQLEYPAALWQRLRHALDLAVNDPKGTSWEARVPGLLVAGKTGTAQLGKTRRGQGAIGDPENDHAWFASFAPIDRPAIAVVVLIEHGGFGAKVATPAAMEIYQAFFRLRDRGAE